MSKDSRIAVSLAPAYIHHWRSNSRISRSRSPRPAAVSRRGCAAASMRLSPRGVGASAVQSSRSVEPHPLDASEVYARNHSDVIQLRRVASSRSDGPMTTRWGILATGKIARSFATDLHEVPGAVIAAVGSRSAGSAEAFARDVGDGQT